MKAITNIVGVAVICFLLGVFDNIKFPFPVFDTTVVEITQPVEYIDATKSAASKVPKNAKIDLAIFNDEFAKKILKYSEDPSPKTLQEIIGSFYPQSFREVFGTKYSGMLKEYLEEVKLVFDEESLKKDKILTSDEFKKISNIYTAIAWNLITPESK